MSLYHLLYISDATKPLSDWELEEVLRRSRPRNKARNITGMLLYSGGHFLQLMEGDEPDVVGLFAKICQDPRHQNVQRLAFQPAPRRLCPEWRMGLLNLDTAAPLDRSRLKAIVRSVQQSIAPGQAASRGADIMALLREFHQQLPATDGPRPLAPAV